MSWASGTYTKWNGAGGWASDASSGIGIEAGRHDTQDTDFQNGINNCLAKDGQNTPTANLPMAGFKHTNVSDATSSNEYMAFGQISNGSTTVSVGSIASTGILVSNTSNTNIGSIRYSADSSPGVVSVAHSRGTTVGTQGLVSNNDTLGRIEFAGSDGVTFRAAARIQGEVDGAAAASDMPGRLVFSTTQDATINCIERMRIDSSGNVGIGTTTPSTLLHIGGATNKSIQVDLASNSAFFGGSGNTSIFSVNRNPSNNVFVDTAKAASEIDLVSGASNAYISFFTTATNNTSPTERMRITAAGNVGIGTTSPSYKLQLSTDDAAKPLTNTWSIASDERIKTNIQPYYKGLAELLQVRPISYDYNGKAGMPIGQSGISIIAQELEPIFPECVGRFYAKLNEGDEQDTELLNYNGHAITFALINAIKELNAKVVALDAKIEALENA